MATAGFLIGDRVTDAENPVPAQSLPMSVRENYQRELQARGFQSDPAQLRAIDALERCAQEWAQYKEQRSNRLKKLINRPPVASTCTVGWGAAKAF